MQNTQVLKMTKTKEVVLSAVFTALAVSAPAVIHYFAGVDGGRTFLPMPFFVLAAGLLLGWRAGLATAIASPVLSYLISGMPLLDILPFVTLQLIVFGMVAGMMKEKYDSFLSITAAIIAGWIVIGVSLFFFSKMNAIFYVSQGIKAGIWGIAFQLIMIPIIAYFAKRYFGNEREI